MNNDEKLAAILAANPVLSDPGFARSVEKWNLLFEIAQARGLSTQDAQAFIAYFMTSGKEGYLT